MTGERETVGLSGGGGVKRRGRRSPTHREEVRSTVRWRYTHTFLLLLILPLSPFGGKSYPKIPKKLTKNYYSTTRSSSKPLIKAPSDYQNYPPTTRSSSKLLKNNPSISPTCLLKSTIGQTYEKSKIQTHKKSTVSPIYRQSNLKNLN